MKEQYISLYATIKLRNVRVQNIYALYGSIKFRILHGKTKMPRK